MELIYCFKCKQKTNSKDIELIKNNNKLRIKAKCCICNSSKSSFTKHSP